MDGAEPSEGVIQRCGDVHGEACPCNDAPPIVGQALRSRGEPLEEATRAGMESRFGHDFSGVRIHNDGPAGESARALSAHAYTLGRDIVFASGRYRPGTAEGERLIAHELAHVVQQDRGQPPAIQRFVPCTRARLSLEECPEREAGEVAASRTAPMEIGYITSPVRGYIISNFGVGQSKLKAGATADPQWQAIVQAMSAANTKWSITGLADCHGDDAGNTALRQDRANEVFGALPTAAAAQVVNAGGVGLHDCLTDNTTAYDRTLNRSVVIRLEETELTFPEEKIEGKRPQPIPQPTVDCGQQEQKEIASAIPIAIAMVEKAMSVALSKEPKVWSIRMKYFNDPPGNWRILAGYKSILEGLKGGTKIECEHKGSFMYSHFCSSSSQFVTWAYVRTLAGTRVHLCEAAFGRGDIDMAYILVHEYSHLYDQTNIIQGETYCGHGACANLDRWDAYDNADSFAWFAREAFMSL